MEADVVFVFIVIGFFALATGLVWWCDRLLGDDSDFELVAGGVGETAVEAAGDPVGASR